MKIKRLIVYLDIHSDSDHSTNCFLYFKGIVYINLVWIRALSIILIDELFYALFTMTKSFTKLLTGLLVVFSWCSCYVREGNDPNDPTRHVEFEFKNVALRFNFNSTYRQNDIGQYLAGDYQELCNYYGLMPNNDYSGEITELFTLLARENEYDADHKPSVTLIAETPYVIDTIHFQPSNFQAGNIVVTNDPFSTTTKGTITVKSPKTTWSAGVQVVWEKIFTENNWPTKEFVADSDDISSDFDSYLKGGTNNDRGDVATRNGDIIPNTYDDVGDPLDETYGPGPVVTYEDNNNRFDLTGVKEENVFISPVLEKPILVGGSVSQSYKWSTPTIYRILQ